MDGYWSLYCLALAVISTIVCTQFFVRFVTPYRLRIPCAHWSSAFSSLWILKARYQSHEIESIHNAHQRLGPVIRLSPNEISVSCIKGGVQTIYAGGFEKHEWYSNLFNNYG